MTRNRIVLVIAFAAVLVLGVYVSSSDEFGLSSIPLTTTSISSASTTSSSTTSTTTSTVTSSTSSLQSSNGSSADSVEIASVRLLYTSVGSPVLFNVTFVNNGDAPIYYAKDDGRTSPVSANIAPSCPTGFGDCPPSPIAEYSVETDCLRTVSFVQLDAGGTAYAYTTYCMGPDYQIVTPGVIRAVISLSWSTNAFDTSSPATSHVISVSQNFTVG